eukprot:6175574-Pleurochrysis_carterae.AAC.2
MHFLRPSLPPSSSVSLPPYAANEPLGSRCLRSYKLHPSRTLQVVASAAGSGLHLPNAVAKSLSAKRRVILHRKRMG